ncbi:hypothetical protein QQ045_018623 [Rhodiola kirilowii]
MPMVDENEKIKHVSFVIQGDNSYSDFFRFPATTERSFSRMNIVKNALRNKMEDDFLSDSWLSTLRKK